MSLFTTLIKKSLKDFFQKWKKWLITLSVIVGLLVALNLVINHYVDNVVGSLIKEFVHEKSNGFYEVEFDEIAYLLNNGRFFVTEFKFDIHPEHRENLQYNKLDQNYLYFASIPRLHIDIIEFWSIFVNKKLRVIGVEVDNPSIKIINLNKNKTPKKLSFEAGNLYEVLSGHLNELKINDFMIKNGQFDYETYQGPDYDNFKIKGLNFEVKNFQVNEKAHFRTDKFFYTDDISLEVKDQVLFLKDSIHKVTFDKFYISTRKNELGFENFNFTRRDNPMNNKKTSNHYEIVVPQLRFSGIDFVSAYNNNILSIDSIAITSPAIDLIKRTKGVEKDSTKNNLLDLAMIFHDYLIVDHFNLSDAQIVITDETKEQPKSYRVDHISAYFSKLELDTSQAPNHSYNFDFDQVNLLVKDYEVTLPDSINTIKFEEFSISSDPQEIVLKDLSIQPDQALASTKKKNQFFLKLPYLAITEFDIAKAINQDTFQIGEIYLEQPEFMMIPASTIHKDDKKIQPDDLFGVFEKIKTVPNQFVLKKLHVVDGNFKLNKHQDRNEIELNYINLVIEDLSFDSLTNLKNDLLRHAQIAVSLKNSMVELPVGKIDVANLSYESSKGRLLADSLRFHSDSLSTQQVIADLPEFELSGIELNQILFDDEILLDTLKMQNMHASIDVVNKLKLKAYNADRGPKKLPLIGIEHLIVNNYEVDYRSEGLPVFSAEDIDVDISNIILDQSLSDNPINQFDYDKINSISITNYDLYLKKQNHYFQTHQISWDGNNATLSLNNVRLQPYGKPNNFFDISVPNITMNGINFKRILKESYYDGNEIVIEQPVIRLAMAMGKQEKLTSLDLGFIPLLLRNRYMGAKANTFKINNANINLHQEAEQDSTVIELQNLNVLIDNFEVDSTTEMKPNRFLFANDVKLQGDYITVYNQSKSDFYNINHYYISTKEGDIRLNGIYMATNTKNDFPEKGQIKVTAENLVIQDLNFFDFTQNQILDVSEILIDELKLHGIPGLKPSVAQGTIKTGSLPADSLLFGNILDKLEKNDEFKLLSDGKIDINAYKKSEQFPSDSTLVRDISQKLKKSLGYQKPENENKKISFTGTTYPFDTLLLKRINVGRILVTNSEAIIDNPNEIDKGLVIPQIWVLAEGLKFDPASARDSSRLFYSDHILAKIQNFKYILPDNLNSISIDELTLNSADSTVKANNFALMPLVAKYDFGPAKGYQSTWLQIENDSITLKNVDYLDIINTRSLNVEVLNVHKLDVTIFRDKRVPFPEWQRRPLPQDELREIDFTINLDTILLHDGYITYQEHSEKAYTTGEVFFSDVNARILNLTNDSIRTLSNPKTKIEASAKLFNEGNVKAEFLFDLVDMENIHSYGIEVDPFDLTEFNRILVPSASVQVSSGENEKIIMTAKANEDYSYGEMKFYYEDLKIALLNRETEKPKGIGNVLGSFFANTFIIKSDNPKNFMLRKGDIFFERDKKRAIFNYWTKTFLSGIISSIGAANNKKKIKKMQEENLKEIQSQKELATKL